MMVRLMTFGDRCGEFMITTEATEYGMWSPLI